MDRYINIEHIEEALFYLKAKHPQIPTAFENSFPSCSRLSVINCLENHLDSERACSNKTGAITQAIETLQSNVEMLLEVGCCEEHLICSQQALTDLKALVEDYPLGAIENGRTFIDKIENNYDFKDPQEHELRNCHDWHELKRCFEHIATILYEGIRGKK